MTGRSPSESEWPALKTLKRRCLALGWKRRPAEEIELVYSQAVKRAKRTHREDGEEPPYRALHGRPAHGRGGGGVAETLIALLAEALAASGDATSFPVRGAHAADTSARSVLAQSLRSGATVTPDQFLAHVRLFAAGWVEEIRRAWAQAFFKRGGALAPYAATILHLRRGPVRRVPLLLVRHDERDGSMQSCVLRRLALGQSGIDVIVPSSLRLLLEDVRAQWEMAVRLRDTRHKVRVTEWSGEARCRKDQSREVRIWSAGHLLKRPRGGACGRMLLHDVVVIEELQDWGTGLLSELAGSTCSVLAAGLPCTAPCRAISCMRHVMLWAPKTRAKLLREVNLQCDSPRPQLLGSSGSSRAQRAEACERRARWCTAPAGAASAVTVVAPPDEDIKAWLGGLADSAHVAACSPAAALRTPTVSEAWCALRHARDYAASRSPELRVWTDRLLCCVFRATVARLARWEEGGAKLRLALQETRVQLCSTCRTPLAACRPGLEGAPPHACLPGVVLPFAEEVLEEAASVEVRGELALAVHLGPVALLRETRVCAAANSPLTPPTHSVSSVTAVIKRLASLGRRFSELGDYAQEMQLLREAARDGHDASGYTVWLAGARSLRRHAAALGATEAQRPAGLLSCVLRERPDGVLTVCCSPSSAEAAPVSSLGAFHAICRHVRRPPNARLAVAAAWVLAERAVCSWLGGGCVLAGTTSFVARWSFAKDVRAIYVAPSFLLGGVAGVACLRRLTELWPDTTCTLQCSGAGEPWAGALHELVEALSRRDDLAET